METKGKMDWLQDGDLNTKFFHLSATVRKKFQKIDMLMRGDGTEVSELAGMCDIAKTILMICLQPKAVN